MHIHIYLYLEHVYKKFTDIYPDLREQVVIYILVCVNTSTHACTYIYATKCQQLAVMPCFPVLWVIYTSHPYSKPS